MALTREEKQRLREIKSAMKDIARIARFMTDKQLAPYEAMAHEYFELMKKKVAAHDKSRPHLR